MRAFDALALALALGLPLLAPVAVAANTADFAVSPHAAPIAAEVDTPAGDVSTPTAQLPVAVVAHARAPHTSAPGARIDGRLARAGVDSVPLYDPGATRAALDTVEVAGVKVEVQENGSALAPTGTWTRGARYESMPFGFAPPSRSAQVPGAAPDDAPLAFHTLYPAPPQDAAAQPSDGPAPGTSPAAPPPSAPPAPRAASAWPAIAAAAAGASVGAVLLVAPWVLYHRFRALEQERRAQLLTLLKERPGLTQADIARALACDASTARYHLRRLAKDGVIVAHDRRYFAPGTVAPQARAAVAAQASGGAERVLETVRAAPGLTLSELAEKLALGRTAASWHLKKLQAASLVRVEREGRALRIVPA